MRAVRSCRAPARAFASASAASKWRASPRYANTLRNSVHATLKEIEAAGTYKKERLILSKQAAQIRVRESREPVLNFCANNYLGLSDNPQLIQAGTRPKPAPYDIYRLHRGGARKKADDPPAPTAEIRASPSSSGFIFVLSALHARSYATTPTSSPHPALRCTRRAHHRVSTAAVMMTFSRN